MTLDDWIDSSAAFRGDELNTEKMERLTLLRQRCREIAELAPEIKSPMIVFDNTCRNGTAQLLLPVVFMLEEGRAKGLLSLLMVEADDVIFSAAGGEHIAISFSVLNMWNKIHFEEAIP